MLGKKRITKGNLSELFGKFKTKKSPQQLKNESRKGWDKKVKANT